MHYAALRTAVEWASCTSSTYYRSSNIRRNICLMNVHIGTVHETSHTLYMTWPIPIWYGGVLFVGCALVRSGSSLGSRVASCVVGGAVPGVDAEY